MVFNIALSKIEGSLTVPLVTVDRYSSITNGSLHYSGFGQPDSSFKQYKQYHTQGEWKDHTSHRYHPLHNPRT